MKIIAASIQQVVDTFLHAGYGSAFPRTLIEWGQGLPRDARPRAQLELAEALRLEGEAMASGLPPGQTPEAPGAALGLLDTLQGQLLVGVTLFFTGLALYYLFRHRLFRHRLALLRPRAAAAAGLALLGAPLLLGWGAAGSGAGPWADVPRRRYRNPALATKALMQTIVADALANAGEVPRGYQYARLELTSLAQIKPEVALPARQLTEGMKYALKTYGLDGWGRPFRVRGRWGYGFRVVSAGPDGAFGTRDDLRTRVHLDHIYEWETRRRAFFLREVDGELVVLFHRSRMRTFRFHDRARARTVTGSELFDLIPVSKLPARQRRRVRRLYKTAKSRGKVNAPLVALIF
jgi:hypothetical protein